VGLGGAVLSTRIVGRKAAAQSSATRIRVGVVPLISAGPIFIAQAKGFFKKAGLDVEFVSFADGALAIPALVAGELDVAGTTLNAGFFNAVSKRAPYVLVLDRGSEKPGSGSLQIAVSNDLFRAGLARPEDAGLLRGKRISIQAPGGIDQYIIGVALQRAGLNPRSDVAWNSGLTYPDIVRSMGIGQTDAAQIPLPLGFQVEKNSFGKLAFPGSAVEPNAQLACWAMSTTFLAANQPAAVRFAMANIYAGRLFNAAAATKDPETIKIISEATMLPAALIESAAPRWTWFSEDGMPNTDSCIRQGNFWNGVMKMVRSGDIDKKLLFDLSFCIEANRQLAQGNPFI
jgi:NitT/TauT family transport system substrate-binding protein